MLGDDVRRIYSHADVFHCEPIEKVADDFIERNRITRGDYDNVGMARYEVPGYWDIGKVFERLIEDVTDKSDVVDGIRKVFSSWLADRILNFNSILSLIKKVIIYIFIIYVIYFKCIIIFIFSIKSIHHKIIFIILIVVN